MKIRVIDFDVLTRNFKPYVDGYFEIEKEKKSMIDQILPIKKNMENLMNKQSLDETESIKLREDQEMLIKMDNEFKRKLKEMTDELNVSVYDQLSNIISKWAIENSIDLVTGKMEVIYNINEIESTIDILNIIKEMKLFCE